ncbi:apolipoprotein N-acyltransferase [Ectothiorhodospiraceae bacterium BW-2]|nr:apolipoprotein N-acyltransferase [Ectothiorhodospiraceae bacterium BW-2]
MAWRRPLLGLLAGAVAPAAFAPLGWYLLLPLSLALLFWLSWPLSSVRRAALLGWGYGLGYFGVGISWISVAIVDMGQTPWPLAALLTLLFVAYLALFPALALALFIALRGYLALQQAPMRALLLLLPLLWTATEWLRGELFTGFPWLNPGYIVTDSVLAGWAPLLGSYGVGGGVVLLAALLALLLLRTTVKTAMLVALMVGGIYLSAALLQQQQWTEPVGERISVALIQGNVSRQSRWQGHSLSQRLARYRELTEPYFGQAALIIWPENAIPTYYRHLEADFFTPLAKRASASGSTIISGGIRYRHDGEGYHTSLTVVGRPEQSYHKRHLVPFGEYLPLESWLRGAINFFNMPMSNFSPGPEQQSPLQVGEWRLAATVCYEDLFAAEMRPLVKEATLLVNGSNNGWYGDSLAPHQHLQIARMRSLEFQRPTLRATTSGISALIERDGKVLARSQQFVAATLSGSVQPMTGLTPYLRWGEWPLVGWAVVVAIGLGLSAGGSSRREEGSASLPP